MATTRIQLALNVEDLAEATAFYARLFGRRRTSCARATPTSWWPTRR